MAETAFQGESDVRQMAGRVANLMLQRGCSFALDASIVFERAELLDYFVGQMPRQSPEAIGALLDQAMQANAHMFIRKTTEMGEEFWARKRILVNAIRQAEHAATGDTLEPPKASGKVVADRPPAAPKEPAKVAPPEPQPAPAHAVPNAPEKPEEELPIIQRYQLAVLQTLVQLGGAAKAADVVQRIPEMMTLPAEHVGTYARGPEGKSEEPKYVKFVHSARRFLIQQGELESPERGVWSITAAGRERLERAG